MKQYDLYIFDFDGTLIDGDALPFPDVKPTLLRLSDLELPLCIATMMMEKTAWSLLEEYGLDIYFDHIVGFDDVTRHKPDPECLFRCVSYYDISKTDTVFIGDSPNDMYAAASAGIDGILIDRKNRHSSLQCTEKIHYLTDII